MRFATKAQHASRNPGPNAPVAPPIALSSTYEWEDYRSGPEYVYSRYQNPNRAALEETIAALEGVKHAVAFGSGMAAIGACLSLAKAGEKVLIASDIYGGTFAYGREILPDRNVTVEEFDALNPDTITPARLLIFETPTNPTLRVADISAIVERCRQYGITSIIDNTFATPYLQTPAAMGVDLVAHSASKYIGGHSDLVLGVVATDDDDLRQHLYTQAKVAGGIPGPFDAWLALRGVRSLAARMRVHCENAFELAKRLEKHPGIERVHYPGLASNPGYELATKQMKDYGGVFSAEIKNVGSFMERCKLFTFAGSLGGTESLMSWPAVLSHASLTPAEREARGIAANLIRFSVGLEDVEDLWEDLEQALR